MTHINSAKNQYKPIGELAHYDKNANMQNA